MHASYIGRVDVAGPVDPAVRLRPRSPCAGAEVVAVRERRGGDAKRCGVLIAERQERPVEIVNMVRFAQADRAIIQQRPRYWNKNVTGPGVNLQVNVALTRGILGGDFEVVGKIGESPNEEDCGKWMQ